MTTDHPQASWPESAEAVTPVDNSHELRMRPTGQLEEVRSSSAPTPFQDGSVWAISRTAGQAAREPQASSRLSSEQVRRAVMRLNIFFGFTEPEMQELSIEELQAEAFGITFGVPTGDAECLTAMRWVVATSAVSAAYHVLSFIAPLIAGQFSDSSDPGSPDGLWSGCSQMIIELSIPACGYYGALCTHRTLIFFFCGANLIFVLASVVNFLRYLIRIDGTMDMCKMERYATSRHDCEALHSDGAAKYVLIFRAVFLMFLGCFGFWAGKQLYQRLGPIDPLQLPFQTVPVVGEVIARPVEDTQSAENATSIQIHVPLVDENQQVLAMAAQLSAQAASEARQRH